MPLVQANNQSLYVEDTGGPGPTIVWSHGFLMDHEMFAPQLDAFRGRYRCIAVDMRNHGQSSSSTARYNIWDTVDDLVAVLDTLEIDRVALVGFSFGGWISTRFALQCPARVSALVILDSYEKMESSDDIEGYRAFQAMIAERGFDEEVTGIMRGFLFGPDYDPDRWIAKWRFRPPSNWEFPYEAMFTRDDINDRLREINCPALVVHGGRNPANGPEVSQDLANRLGAGAKMVVVGEAGHTSNLEQPGPVNEELANFFESALAD